MPQVNKPSHTADNDEDDNTNADSAVILRNTEFSMIKS